MQANFEHESSPPPAKRVPPWSEDCEQAVLSAILQDGRAAANARAILTADAFYSLKHRRMFKAMCALHDAQSVIDPLTLSEQLTKTNELVAAGGKEYIGELIDVVPFGTNVEHHARIVRERAAQRDLISSLHQAAQLAWSADANPAKIAQDLVASFLPLAVPKGGEGYVAASEVLYSVLEEIEQRSQKLGLIGVPTGFTEIDDITGGWREGELVGICGVPKSGKSVVLMSFALNNVVDGIDVGIVTAEMQRKAVIERMLASLSGIESRAIRNGRLDADAWKRLIRAAQRLRGDRGGQLFIDETPGPSLSEVVARARALKIRQPSVRILYVDYLQLLHADDETHAEELRQISQGLHELALELAIPVIAAAQLNDKVIEQRADKRPTPADVQGSSGLRQACSYLGLIYRAQMYEERAYDSIEIQFPVTRSAGVFDVRLEADMAHMRLRSPRNPEPVVQRQGELGVHT
jgi:replicative DNA helicase